MDVETTSTPSDQLVKFTITFKKQTFNFERPTTETLGQFRQEVAKQTGVAAGLQKLMFKGREERYQ